MFPTNFFLHWPKKSVKQYENQPIKSSSNHSNFQKNQADSTDMLAALYWMRSQEISQVTIIHPEGDVNVRRCFDNLSNNSVWTKVVARLTNWCCHLRAALRARSWGHDLSVFNYCCGHTCALVRFFLRGSQHMLQPCKCELWAVQPVVFLLELLHLKHFLAAWWN